MQKNKGISDSLETLIKEQSPNNLQLKDFIKADEEYQKLVQEGLAMKRGFNLMTIAEIYNPQLSSAYSQTVNKFPTSKV